MDKLGKIILSITFILFLPCRKKELIIPNPPVYSPVDDEPTWSPDGKLIAYTHFPYLDTAFANYEIWILNIENGEKRFLCYGFQPDFSPNGKKIAFVDVINYGIAIINVNGDSLVHLTYGRGLSPHWSPDGKKVVFSGRLKNQDGWNGPQIYVINADGTNLKQLTTEGGANHIGLGMLKR
jgi:TolB protein